MEEAEIKSFGERVIESFCESINKILDGALYGGGVVLILALLDLL